MKLLQRHISVLPGVTDASFSLSIRTDKQIILLYMLTQTLIFYFFFNFYFLERTVWNRQNQSFIGKRVCPSLVMLNYLNNILPSEKVLSYIHLELRLTLLFTLLFISSSGREKKEKKEKRALRIKCNTPPNTHSIPHKDKTIK